MENYFLIHWRSSNDIRYVFYTEHELRTLHQTFGHPSVRALKILLRRQAGSPMIERTPIHWKSSKMLFKHVGKSCQPHTYSCWLVEQVFCGSIIGYRWIQCLYMTACSGYGWWGDLLLCGVFPPLSADKENMENYPTHVVTYGLGTTEYLFVDQESAYTSKEIKQSLSASGDQLDEASIETSGAIQTV